MLDFRINTFLTVCQFMNYTKAADELHITQPAVSQHIHYLEELYHAELFHREGKKISLSPAGKLLLQTATALKNDETLMIDQMNRPNPDQLPLIFGITMTIGEFAIADPLARYIHRHPDSQVKMIMGNTKELLNGLRTGDIHFALVEGYFPTEEYESLVYRTEDFIPVCAASHQFAKAPTCIKDLLKERLILREPGSGTRDILERNLSAKNISLNEFHHVAEISNMTTIVKLLKMDCGISFLYKAAVAEELSTGILKEIHLSDFNMNHDFTFIWNKGSIFAKHYKKICQELQ